MTAHEKCRLILRKYPEAKYNRSDFWWKCFCEFYGAKFYLTEGQWREAYKDFQAIDRALRDVLKEPNFKLEPEADQKRYQKEAEFVNNLKGKVG